MRLPLEIRNQNGILPASVDEAIRERAAKLDLFYEKIMRCRVTIEGPGPHHRKGRHCVRLDITVPGNEIVVSHQAGKDLLEAVKEAFNAAERRIEDYVRRARRFVKSHEARAVEPGRVQLIFREKDYGFLKGPEGHDVYFHRNSVAAPGFDSLDVGSAVEYSEEPGEKGPQATRVIPMTPAYLRKTSSAT